MKRIDGRQGEGDERGEQKGRKLKEITP